MLFWILLGVTALIMAVGMFLGFKEGWTPKGQTTMEFTYSHGARRIPHPDAGKFRWHKVDYFDSLFTPFMAGLTSAGLSACVLLILGAVSPAWSTFDKVRSENLSLKSMSSTSTLNGHSYFLAGGYVKEDRVLYYIQQHNSYTTLEQAQAKRSIIIEDSPQQPFVTANVFDENKWWLVPFPVNTKTHYEFHIPAGSVSSEFEVNNK